MPAPARALSTHPSRTRPGAAVVVGGVALAALALTGCAGASSSGSSATASAAASSSAAVDGGTGAVPAPAAPGQAKDSATSAGSGAVGAPLSVVTDRSIVVKADVSVQVDDVLRSTSALGALATTHDATIASQSISAGTPVSPDLPTNPDGSPACPSTGCPTSYASSTTTLRLANSEVDNLLADVAKLGTVAAATRTSDDVTADVADVDARVQNARASLSRVRALMSQATKIGDVVALEGELSRRQSDLEALEARQRALADQTAQATVTVRLLGASAPVPPPVQDSTGFLAGLKAGWDSFTGFTAGALTVVGALVPWLIVLVPAGLLVWSVVRRRRMSPNVVDGSAEAA